MDDAPTTGTVTVSIDPDAIRERNDAARQMVSDLCHQRREWMMSIPARRDYDPDLVISASLQDVRKLLLAYESVKERADQAEADLDEIKPLYVQKRQQIRDLASALATAVAQNQQITTALQALYDDWPGPLTEAMKTAQTVLQEASAALPARDGMEGTER